MIEWHAVVWTQKERTGTIRRAKRDVMETRSMADVRAANDNACLRVAL
jgi:hypothetical protein